MNTKKCSECGTEISENEKFCHNCGKPNVKETLDEKSINSKESVKSSEAKEKITMKLYLFIMNNILRLFKKILTKQK